jgi:DNA-binding CsgD family transcriptional regulator
MRCKSRGTAAFTFRRGLRQFFRGAGTGANQRVASLLTPREREVVGLLADGLEYKQIADRLKISPNTVNNHLAHVREKLGVHSAIEAINKLYPRPG